MVPRLTSSSSIPDMAMANLFVMLVNHNLDKFPFPEQFPRHLLNEQTRRSLTAERRLNLYVWNVADGPASTDAESMTGNAKLCVPWEHVNGLYRAAHIVYAASELSTEAQIFEGLAQAHGRDIATAMRKCADIMEQNFNTCHDALHRACAQGRWS